MRARSPERFGSPAWVSAAWWQALSWPASWLKTLATQLTWAICCEAMISGCDDRGHGCKLISSRPGIEKTFMYWQFCYSHVCHANCSWPGLADLSNGGAASSWFETVMSDMARWQLQDWSSMNYINCHLAKIIYHGVLPQLRSFLRLNFKYFRALSFDDLWDRWLAQVVYTLEVASLDGQQPDLHATHVLEFHQQLRKTLSPREIMSWKMTWDS